MEMAMETDGDGSGGTSPSRQGAGIETSVPRNSSAAAAELWNSFWKILSILLGFSIGRLLIGEWASSGGDQGDLTTGGTRPSPWPCPLMVRLAPGPPPALVRSSVLFREK
jgi:hypothetical protein